MHPSQKPESETAIVPISPTKREREFMLVPVKSTVLEGDSMHPVQQRLRLRSQSALSRGSGLRTKMNPNGKNFIDKNVSTAIASGYRRRVGTDIIPRDNDYDDGDSFIPNPDDPQIPIHEEARFKKSK